MTANSQPRTQALISFQLWELRREFYPKYLDGSPARADGFRSQVIMSAWGPSTSGGYKKRYLTASTCENNVANRLLLQAMGVLKEFLPLYSVNARDPFAQVPSKLANFFMMVKGGRIVIREFSKI